MILSRLGVRDKLNLLLLLPLAAIVLLSIPFLADRVADARAAAATASTARVAQQAGTLIQELQRERLLSLAYLVSPRAGRSALVAEAQNVADQVTDLRVALGPRPAGRLSGALARLSRLGAVRQGVWRRSVSQARVHQAFGDAITGLLDALGLPPQSFADAVGARQVGALDALLRADEQSSSGGTALLVMALDREAGSALLAQATSLQRLCSQRFLQLASPTQAGMLRLVDASRAVREVDALTRQIRQRPGGPGGLGASALVSTVPAAVDLQTKLRRLVEGRITRDIADGAAQRARDARTAAWVFAGAALALFAAVVGLSVRVSRSIAVPLRKLTLAAGAVADLAGAELVRLSDEDSIQQAPPRLAAIDVAAEDEVGELAVAFNRVQATAALLLERQVVSRGNVSAMFANVGRRVRNLAGRQLSLIDDLERDEQDRELLAKLYQLDHVSTRLRRSAYSLLVVSGARDEGFVTEPASVATVLRSALGEIEGFQGIRLGQICEVVVSPELVADLALLLAELLENASSFSPPGVTVDVTAELVDGGCLISLVDHGIGMSSEQLDEENHRLVERERLDIVPTSVLGLFVVGRLARRHGLSVHLEPTPGQGITARILVPSSYLSGAVAPAAPEVSADWSYPPAASPEPVSPLPLSAALAALPVPGPSDHFSWFSVDEPAGAGHGTLTRRIPGAQLPDIEPEPRPLRPPTTTRDPEATRALVESFQAGLERAARQTRAPEPTPTIPPAPAAVLTTTPGQADEPSRNGLTRRVPGSHLAAALRDDQRLPAGPRAARVIDPWAGAPARPARDPRAERAALDAFIQGFEAGNAGSGTTPLPEDHRRGGARPEGGSR
jgi:signal transduction histidine kinase